MTDLDPRGQALLALNVIETAPTLRTRRRERGELLGYIVLLILVVAGAALGILLPP